MRKVRALFSLKITSVSLSYCKAWKKSRHSRKKQTGAGRAAAGLVWGINITGIDKKIYILCSLKKVSLQV